MVSRRAFLASGVVGGTLAASGCLDALPLDDPPVEDAELRITDVRSPSLGLSSMSIPVLIEVENTNDSDELPAPTVDYTATINEAEVASSGADIPTLGPGESVVEEFELVADYVDIGSSVLDAVESGDFTVTLTGEIVSEDVSAEVSDSFSF